MNRLPTKNGPLPLQARETYRASGLCVCPDCDRAYYDHPVDHFELSNYGEPFLQVLCNGDRVKL